MAELQRRRSRSYAFVAGLGGGLRWHPKFPLSALTDPTLLHFGQRGDSIGDVGQFSGVTYAYRVAPPTPPTPSTKWALLLHGFPADTYSWQFVVPALVVKGYHVAIPDMLAYGGTDEPLDVNEFKSKKMCRRLIGIMVPEGAQTFIAAGHGWVSRSRAVII